MSDRLFALRLFVRVARTRSFSAAGREKGLSQPSASRLVSPLEREVGHESLLTRTTRAVTGQVLRINGGMSLGGG